MTNHVLIARNAWWARRSAGIQPRRQRQLALLARAARRYSDKPDSPEIGISLHREGGLAYKGDIADLVYLGLLEIKRVPYSRGWGGDYWLRRTMAFLTDAGRSALERGSIK